jgi:hypothetical protein
VIAQAAAPEAEAPPPRRRFRLPERVPPFNTATDRIFTVIWTLALALAFIGPIGGLYQRYMAPEDNSQLVLLGSRAGFAVSQQDATHIRFRVGPFSKAAGIRKGDDIVAIYGIPLPDKMPVTERALAEHADDPAYIVMRNLLFGTEELPVPLTLRSPTAQSRTSPSPLANSISTPLLATAASRRRFSASSISFRSSFIRS